jgi:RNA polymerase sigma-70 factor (ECF subfamily)
LKTQTLEFHQELVDAIRVGERSAQYEIYKLYGKAMYNVALRIVRLEEEAEDILQDSFVSAFNAIASYRGDATFGAWLKRIVINNALSKMKARKLAFEELTEQHEEIDDSDDAVDFSADGIRIEKVKEQIELLPDGYRTVLCLYLLEGYDHNEIADILNISVSTSKSQYKRAKDLLKRNLTQNEIGR